MTETEILSAIKVRFPESGVEWVDAPKGDKYAFVPADKLTDVVLFLKETSDLFFDYLVNLSAFDAAEHIEVTYHFYSYKFKHSFILKVKVPRQNGEVPTLSNIYGTANYQEREVYDHFGVKFKGHPNLIRILLPQDWVGHPLLKDYKEEAEYNGIETTRPSLL